MKKRITLLMLFVPLFSLQGVLQGCGVKGKPMPPLTAPPIGRGQPTLAQPAEDPSATPDPRPVKKAGSRDNP